ncbi:unnamed protein product, partial [Ixodes pacificus]
FSFFSRRPASLGRDTTWSRRAACCSQLSPLTMIYLCPKCQPRLFSLYAAKLRVPLISQKAGISPCTSPLWC